MRFMMKVRKTTGSGMMERCSLNRSPINMKRINMRRIRMESRKEREKAPIKSRPWKWNWIYRPTGISKKLQKCQSWLVFLSLRCTNGGGTRKRKTLRTKISQWEWQTSEKSSEKTSITAINLQSGLMMRNSVSKQSPNKWSNSTKFLKLKEKWTKD